jgi:hypothetical protein
MTTEPTVLPVEPAPLSQEDQDLLAALPALYARAAASSASSASRVIQGKA